MAGWCGLTGHAVNPSMGARWRHPWRQRSCQPTPPHLRQISRGCWQLRLCSARLLVGVDLGRHDFSLRYRMSHPRMAWIYCVDQGRHPPTATHSAVPTDRGKLSKAGWVRLRECPRHGCRGQAPKDGFTASPATGPTPPSLRKPASAVAVAVALDRSGCRAQPCR
ncbi:Uncharacterised protein [Acinetobacter baumannii]|nr:Uncharacterised protein [Acinetobacter baumannii]